MSENGHDIASKHGLRFDPVIRLDNALTLAALVVGAVTAWVNLTATQQQQAKDLARIERATELAMPRSEAKTVEAVLVDKIAEARSRIDQTNVRMEGLTREIKESLTRIEEKLDRKQDKPGR